MSSYDRGYAAGYAEAVKREMSDSATASDADTWFTGPATGPQITEERDMWAYQNGFGDGWADYFIGRDA